MSPRRYSSTVDQKDSVIGAKQDDVPSGTREQMDPNPQPRNLELTERRSSAREEEPNVGVANATAVKKERRMP